MRLPQAVRPTCRDGGPEGRQLGRRADLPLSGLRATPPPLINLMRKRALGWDGPGGFVLLQILCGSFTQPDAELGVRSLGVVLSPFLELAL